MKRNVVRSLLCATVCSLSSLLPAKTPGAQDLIDGLHMAKIPDEGAWFAVNYASPERIPAAALPARYGASRGIGTSIYALVTREDFSAMHRLKTDEIWHVYAGDPIELLLLHPDGKNEIVHLGSDVLGGQKPQFTVPAGVWMGARPLTDSPEAYSLFGCTMAPGFDYADFTPGYRDELIAAFPEQAAMITALTRTPFAHRSSPASSESAPAPTSPSVFSPSSVPVIPLATGVELQELVGRTAAARSPDYSVARFALAPERGTGTSYNKIGEEVFLIISGRGTLVLGEEASSVTTGSVVVIPAGLKHSLTAAPDSSLEFYALTWPAFSPDDYVRCD
jgi:uncharacterized protein